MTAAQQNERSSSMQQGDLQLRPPDTWLDIRVPAGWEPVENVCRKLHNDAPTLTERIVGAIENQVPAYRDLPAVPRGDLVASVASNFEMILFGIAERRGPTAGELEVRRELGHRRALQGHPVDALIQAFQVGYREIWEILVEEASNDPVVSSLLLSAVTTLWEWVYEVSSAVADTYLSTTRTRELALAGLRQRFLELLMSGDLESDELPELARSLGFDPDDEFQAVCIRPDEILTDEVHKAERALSGTGAIAQSIPRGGEVLVLVQSKSECDPAGLLSTHLPKTRIGGGMRRRSLIGARLSIGDAERALLTTGPKHSVNYFEDDWLSSTLASSRQRLEPILEPAVLAATAHPEFAEAVMAFSAAGFSVSEASRRLVVHPNTAMYRLKRWEELTGCDPRTFDGLVRSIAAIRMAG